jgi:hypothetical protein
VGGDSSRKQNFAVGEETVACALACVRVEPTHAHGRETGDDVVFARPTDVPAWREVFAAVRRGSAHRPSIARALSALEQAAGAAVS